MASVNRFARSAAKSSRSLSLSIALSAVLSCGVVAGSIWAVATGLSALHEAGRTISDHNMQFSVALANGRILEQEPTAIKSGRYRKTSESEIRQSQLTAEAIQKAHHRSVFAKLALADKAEKADRVTLVAAAAPAKPSPLFQGQAIAAGSSLMTALVEDLPTRSAQPFDLVLDEGKTEQDFALPSVIPLPEARPSVAKVIPDATPAPQKPSIRKNTDTPDAVAVAKPERSLFGDLFKRKSDSGGWTGNNRKVAIYDVSNATVYLPDGTKLRAHSGIGAMRDNPRYEHVKMRGPTPAGIYRLSMREKRFYGVEAIRMTSIDGRDPKNRTGLLTHTNLLRGQKGSHGCVAFQDYQPFLNAFKRGKITTMVVVPELPSSQTQLAALYRKAGV